LESKINVSIDLKDSTLDVDDKGLKEVKNPNYGVGWTTVFWPEQTFISKLISSEISEGIGGLSRPFFGIGVLNPSRKYYDNELDPPTRQITMPPGLNEYFAPSIGTYFGTNPLVLPNGETSVLVSRPTTDLQVPEVPNTNSQVPNTSPQVPNTNSQVPTINPQSSNIQNVQIPTQSPQQYMTAMSNVNWQNVGILLWLIKLGLFKLKAVGFINTLFLFLFKIKLILTFVIFKFIFIFNILLFSKFFMSPLFLLPLFSILVSIFSPTFMVELLSIPRKIINMVLGPAYFSEITPASTSVTETSSSTSAITTSLNYNETTIIPASATKTRPMFKILTTSNNS